MKYTSHKFLVNRLLVHKQSMGKGNILEHLLFGRMIGLGHQDGFPMVSALVCMVTYWIGPTMSHYLRISSRYDITKLQNPTTQVCAKELRANPFEV